MSEVIIGTNNQCKRRLPAWLQSNDTSKNEKCENSDEIFSTSLKRKETVDVVPQIQSMSTRTDVELVERKKDAENKENYSMKKARKPKHRANSKDSTRNFVRSKRKVEDDVTEEDEAELTVEDLISIAEEVLTAHKAMQLEQSVPSEPKSSKSETNSSRSSATLKEKFDGQIRSCRLLSKCNQTSTHPNPLEHNQTDESMSVSSNTIIPSGDAAQDMLELFLGPLLRKAPPASETQMTRELLASSYESEGRVRSFVDVADCQTLVKKKTSLKDKVVMLLD